jgi:F-box protein 11
MWEYRISDIRFIFTPAIFGIVISRRFESSNFRKTIYQRLFEYDLPMFRQAPTKFELVPIDECEFDNPWMESLKQLYKGIHVRQGCKDMYIDNLSGRDILCVDTIAEALSVGGDSPLILVHGNKYVGDGLQIGNNAKIIGAAPGNVADNVILETDRESTVVFVEGAQTAYIGFVTLKFSPDIVASSAQHHKHYCLEVRESCAPTVDHCVIRSLSAGKRFSSSY